MEVAGVKNPLGFYNIYSSSLDQLANITCSVSLDGGTTWTQGQINDQVPVNDRQWNAAYGASTVWLSFRSLATGNNLFCYRSVANGLPGTYQGPFPVYADVVTEDDDPPADLLANALKNVAYHELRLGQGLSLSTLERAAAIEASCEPLPVLERVGMYIGMLYRFAGEFDDAVEMERRILSKCHTRPLCVMSPRLVPSMQ